jgi:hypothetical protein
MSIRIEQAYETSHSHFRQMALLTTNCYQSIWFTYPHYTLCCSTISIWCTDNERNSSSCNLWLMAAWFYKCCSYIARVVGGGWYGGRKRAAFLRGILKTVCLQCVATCPGGRWGMSRWSFYVWLIQHNTLESAFSSNVGQQVRESERDVCGWRLRFSSRPMRS